MIFAQKMKKVRQYKKVLLPPVYMNTKRDEHLFCFSCSFFFPSFLPSIVSSFSGFLLKKWFLSFMRRECAVQDKEKERSLNSEKVKWPRTFNCKTIKVANEFEKWKQIQMTTSYFFHLQKLFKLLQTNVQWRYTKNGILFSSKSLSEWDEAWFYKTRGIQSIVLWLISTDISALKLAIIDYSITRHYK